jgi:hypothetical protein
MVDHPAARALTGFLEITEIAQKLRKQAELPDEPLGLVSEESADLVATLAGKT